MRRISFLVISLLILFFSSCKTYTIPVDSFQQQFAAAGYSKSRLVTVEGPRGYQSTIGFDDTVSYRTYPMDSIKCLDKDGKQYGIKVSPSIEIRFTYEDNRRVVFYFDLMTVNDYIIEGIRSRFIPSIRKTIQVSTIKKIEVQDGMKKFRYIAVKDLTRG